MPTSRIKIRVATARDISLVLDLGFEFFKSSPYKDMTPDPISARRWLIGLIDSGCVILADEDSFICGTTLQLPFASETVAAELAWGSLKKGLQRTRAEKLLLEAFEYWARNVAKAGYIQIGSFHGEKFFLRRGYQKCETMFMAGLN